jgi:HlyD family secretion protein
MASSTTNDLAPTDLRRGFSDETSEARRRIREKRRKRSRAVRRGLLAVLGVAGLAGAALALRPKPVPADLSPVVRGPLSVVIEESGVTRVKDRYLVSAPVSGNLARIALQPGDRVREGDVLAEIAPAASPLLDERARAEAEARLGASNQALAQARAQIDRARNAKELADTELARLRPLAATGSIARQVLDQAEFAARMRADELASAEFAAKVAREEVRRASVSLGKEPKGAELRHIDVLAPVSGQILRVQQENAGFVAAAAPLLEVGDPAALEIVVDLLTTDAVRVRTGTPVEIDDWGGDSKLLGRVRQVEPSGFTRPSALGIDEQRVNVVVVLTEPRERWASLGDGYHVEARLSVWQSESVLKVPHGALFRRGDGWAVFRVEDERARLTSVEIGHRGQTEVEVLSGLGAGTRVIVHPGDRVKDGVRVESQ